MGEQLFTGDTDNENIEYTAQQTDKNTWTAVGVAIKNRMKYGYDEI